jgi:hypothetical protein
VLLKQEDSVIREKMNLKLVEDQVVPGQGLRFRGPQISGKWYQAQRPTRRDSRNLLRTVISNESLRFSLLDEQESAVIHGYQTFCGLLGPLFESAQHGTQVCDISKPHCRLVSTKDEKRKQKHKENGNEKHGKIL